MREWADGVGSLIVEADYVIVGAGAAGCVLAERLSRDPSVSVLLVEHGPPARNPLFRVPKGFYLTMRHARYTHRYRVGLPGGRHETWVRGKVLGGSAVINGMMYLRGDRTDYDDLAAGGSPGWSWVDMLPVFRAMEDHALGRSPHRGAGGPLPVSITEAEYEDVLPAVLRAADALGVAQVPDINAADGARMGFTPVTIRGGFRVGARAAFLVPARHRPNVAIMDRARAGHLLFDGARAVGAAVRHRGHRRDVTARRQVVVAAGAIESPLLLERSGIGRPDILHRAGVTVRVDSPGVGEGLIEQRAVTIKARLCDRLGLGPRLDTRTKRAGAALRYLAGRGGPVSTGAYELAGVVGTGQDGARPDAQVLGTPLVIDPGPAVARYPGVTLQGYPLRPSTRGSVHISDPDPGSPPTIDGRFLESAYDRAVTSGILRWQRSLLATPPLADLVVEETAPGPDTGTENEAVRHALDTGAGIYHAVGSCAMGPDEDDVVDSRARVRGAPGLRVVDASLFPSQPSGGLAGPTMAAAWRVADLLAEEL